ncbi:MAG: hypothetical protein ACI4BH_07405 [Muribaculaceae bacterium]
MNRLLLLITLWLSISLPLSAQIEKIELQQNSANAQVEDIVIVFKMHFDIGYTDWAESVLQKYSTSMIDCTLESLQQTAALPESDRFVWTLPGWPMKYILDNASPAHKPIIEQALRSGRLAPHALPFTFETESSDLETLVRSMSFTSDINRRYRRPLARGAKLTDVPSHSWILPTLLTHAGVNILHIGCNPGSKSPDVPTLFWWEGPDGSRLLTFNWAEYYGSGVMPPKSWKHKTWLAMIHTHENTGAPTAAEVEAVLKEAHQKAPNARVRIGQIEDFYDLLMKENPQLPVVRGDMPDTWIHGYMSMPREVKINKKMQRTIYNEETLNSLLADWTGMSQSISKYIDTAVEQSILFDEHTFGLALSHGQGGLWQYGDDFVTDRADGAYDFIEESWYEKGHHVHAAQQAVVPPLRRDLQALATSIAVTGKRVVVYNPLPWERSGVVSFHMDVYQKNFDVAALRDEVSGNIVPADNRQTHLAFFADNVPPLGYKTYTIIENADYKHSADISISKQDAVIENRYFKIHINRTNGSLLSAFDKINRKEMVKQDTEYGFGEYIHEKYGNDDADRYNSAYVKDGHHGWADPEMVRPHHPLLNSQTLTGKVSHIGYDLSDIAATATAFCTADDGEEYIIMYRLYDNAPYIEITWSTTNKKASMQAEGGWLAFPFNVDNAEFRVGRIGAIVNPKTEFVKSTNHDYFFLNTGMAVLDNNNSGFGINSPNAPGVSLQRMGLTHFSSQFAPQEPNVFVNLYNTQWGTNFTEYIEGSLSAKLYIWAIDRYNNEPSLITPVEETRTPLMGVFADTDKAGNLPASASGLKISQKGVLVTAYKKSENGNPGILRLWEQAGNDGKCIITLPSNARYTLAQPCNLRNEPTSDPIPIKNGILTLQTKAYQPISLLLR